MRAASNIQNETKKECQKKNGLKYRLVFAFVVFGEPNATYTEKRKSAVRLTFIYVSAVHVDGFRVRLLLRIPWSEVKYTNPCSRWCRQVCVKPSLVDTPHHSICELPNIRLGFLIYFLCINSTAIVSSIQLNSFYVLFCFFSCCVKFISANLSALTRTFAHHLMNLNCFFSSNIYSTLGFIFVVDFSKNLQDVIIQIQQPVTANTIWFYSWFSIGKLIIFISSISFEFTFWLRF